MLNEFSRTQLLLGAEVMDKLAKARVAVFGVGGVGGYVVEALARSGVGALDLIDSDISKTSVCPLAKVMRRELLERGVTHLKVVWSPEPPLKPAGETGEQTAKRSVPGSVAFVPLVAGLILAGEVVKDLIAAG